MATGRIPTTANSPLTVKGDLFGYSTTQARVPVGNDGETLVADSSTSTGLNYKPLDAAGKNAVINGGMDIWQRGTSFALASGIPTYTADRWYNARSAAGQTVSRQVTGDTTNLPNIQYCARVQRDSGNTSTTEVRLAQAFETVNSIPVAGQTVTLSFYARRGANYSSLLNGLGSQIIIGTGTDQNPLTSGYTGQSTLSSATPTLTTTWQRFTQTATVSATATEITVLFTYTPVGTAGAADFFEVTGVQLELGSVATTFSRAGGTIQGELAACQRYYYRAQATANYSRWAVGQCTSSTAAAGFIKFPITMRTSPSSLEQTGTASNYGLTNSGTTVIAVSSVPTFDSASPDGSTVVFNVSSGLSAGNATQFLPNGNTTAYLGWSAEL
jgi:hypothetical protein